jgi:hypothetical protein
MRHGKILTVVIAAGLALSHTCDAIAQTAPINGDSSKRGAIMTTQQATGPFDVKLNPLQPHNNAEEAKFARMSIDKQFHGDLEATSKGEMLSAGSDVKGSAGYVAIERVTGTLHGRHGSFTLQHNATMTRGEPYLNIIVVPDSATGELTGLSGNMRIIIAEGKHSYAFDYTLPQ